MNEPELYREGTDVSRFGYTQELKRSMNVWHLTAFGLNYMVPIAPAIIFGILLQISGGTVALPYLLAFFVMMLTALSYGVMVRNFPLAGSVYNYVSRGWNPHVGFIAGWGLALDYILIPTVTSMSSALYAHQIFPDIPYWALLAFFAVAMGLLNLFGVSLFTTAGLLFLIIGEFVVWTSFIVWGYAVSVHHVGTGTLFSTEPFHFKDLPSLITATSLAVFSYLGFDAVTTLAEETHRPKRDIPKAIYLSVTIGALTMILTGYLGMLAIPDWEAHIHDSDWVNTTLFQVAKITGGDAFSIFYTAGYLTQLGVFNIVATAAGARLLYGMGRDNLLPKRVFGKINKKWNTPHWNIILIVSIEFILGMFVDLATLSNLVNYGALFGFCMLNFSVVWLYYVKKKGESPLVLGAISNWRPSGWRHLRYFVLPIVGCSLLMYVWFSMDALALKIGTTWIVVGIVLLAAKTKGFKQLPPTLEL